MKSNNGSRKVLFVVLLLVIVGVLVYGRNTPKEDLGATALTGLTPSTIVPTPQTECPANASLTVLSPNGAEKYQSGQQVTVTWDNCGTQTSSNVSIDLVQTVGSGPTSTMRLLAATPNDGNQIVTLPTSSSWPAISYGNNFKINIRYVSPTRTVIEDLSNQLFTITDLKVVMGTPSYNRTVNGSGQVTSVTYSIPLKITSLGDTVYLGQTVYATPTVDASRAFALVFQSATNSGISDLISSSSIALSSSDANIEVNGFRLDKDQTKNFTITAILIVPATQNTSYRVQLKQIQVFTNPGLFTGRTIKNLLPPENYRTDYQFINN